ncbi:somatostatin receptor type 5-like [Saccostrea cucullata]|uniref:somatostatin receptor type 5-like n=1 Tax=Saccostrea cuccullata TaxID=36930 RepID=UPI002ED02F86
MAETLQTLSSITTESMLNATTPEWNYDCDVNDTRNGTTSFGIFPITAKTVILVTSYSLIFVVGLIGNGLVIYVVLRFAKMKTVTNLYILNLAVSDALFLASLPFLIVTTIIKHWIFGTAMCKIYFVLFSINFFASVFQLTALSADRYLAVCHPVRSSRYRNTTIAFLVCLVMWSVSFIIMLPIILYSNTYANSDTSHQTCTIMWPEGQAIPADKAFTWYTFLLGFLIPVSLISVLYISVILRLQNVGPAIKSKERKRSHRKVTRMVLAVISVYVVCWLPYWVFQINLTFLKRELEEWEIYLFNGLTVLQFANSMLNPLLYAFLSENFRRSFVKAFQCASSNDVNKSLCHENSIFPKSSQKKKTSVEDKKKAEKFEMATMITTAENVNHQPKNGSASSLNEGDGLYVDKESQTLQEDV